MLMKDNLIRLYFLNKGSFEGIEKTSFMSNYSKDENSLYEILGFTSGLGELTASQVYELRKEFVLNSYNPNYKKSLMSKYKASTNSELVDILMSKNILGLERKHISTLGEFRNCGIPSKFINQKISHALDLLESKLNYSTYNGNRLVDYRKDLLFASPSEVPSIIESYRIDLDALFQVRYYDNNSSIIEDNVLYISAIDGYTEDEVRDILFRCYLLGLPKVPLYLRKTFLASISGTLSLFDLDSVHNLIDIANINKCSVKDLLNSFGFNLLDPEDMFRRYNGFFSLCNNEIYFSNETSELFYKFSLNKFTEMVSSKELQTFNINYALALDEMQGDGESGSIENANFFK